MDPIQYLSRRRNTDSAKVAASFPGIRAEEVRQRQAATDECRNGGAGPGSWAAGKVQLSCGTGWSTLFEDTHLRVGRTRAKRGTAYNTLEARDSPD